MTDLVLTVIVVALIALLIRMRRDRLAGRDGRGPQLRSIPFSDGTDGEFVVGKQPQE